MEQNIEVYAKKGYALKGYALGGICLKGICLRGNMPNRFYDLKGICLDTVKFYAKKGLCLKRLCPKGIMPYDSMPNYRQTTYLVKKLQKYANVFYERSHTANLASHFWDLYEYT